MTQPLSTNPQAILISVGGSPDPILFTLKKYRPAHIWYFCSKESRNIADEIHDQLDWHPKPDYIELERYEELGPCYKELRSQIPNFLKKWHIKREDVLVDYTCGTKTMAAALVLAGVEQFKQFSYIGAHQREKEGLGITMWGQEKAFYQNNPWNELSIREIERACDLWAANQFEPASQIISQVTSHVSNPLQFKALKDLASAMNFRHRLDFKQASKKLNSLRGHLPSFFDGRDNYGLIDFVKSTQQLCGSCQQSSSLEQWH